MIKHQVYICSSFRNEIINSEIYNVLSNEGISTYSPILHTKQDNFYIDNTEAISKSSIILAVLDYTGRDFCFEIGYASALNKIIICINTNQQIMESTSMLNIPLKVIHNNLTDLVEHIKLYFENCNCEFMEKCNRCSELDIINK